MWRDPVRAAKVLRQLHAIGVRLSLDDSGTGYSSLSHLRKLPIDEVKIDRSFVSAMRVRADDATIVRSIIDLAHNLKLTVVAEGVEDKETCELLAALGCDCAQGYYFARPAPAGELALFDTDERHLNSARATKS